jgi:hypothetical protein
MCRMANAAPIYRLLFSMSDVITPSLAPRDTRHAQRQARSADDDASDDTSKLYEGDISNFNCLGLCVKAMQMSLRHACRAVHRSDLKALSC